MNKKYILNTANYYTEYFVDDIKRTTIVVSPGGGYLYTSPRESMPVSNVFNKLGYHVVVVNYRETKDESYPKTAKYLAYVLSELKKNSKVGYIVGLGFSAGGHNMLEVALHENIYNVKLDLLMLGYPVVTTDNRYWHEGSFKNLLHDDFGNEKLLKRLSLENEVTSSAPDLFLWGTFTDESVDVMNSLLLMEAYKKNGCNCEYHCFPMGGHGLSVSNDESSEGNALKKNDYIARWTDFADAWIKNKLKKGF